MEHAKVGDIIKIVDDNHGDWVKVGWEYRVETVGEGYLSEKVYGLKDVDQSWCGEPCHFEITGSIVSAAKTHPKYDTFQKGDTVCRWRDVEHWEWDGIGEVELPELGDHVDVASITIDNTDREDMFYSNDTGWNYPMRAFVLVEYYNQSITNRGTAELNNNSYGKSKDSTSSIGKSIEVQRPTPSISTGKRNSGSGVQGRGNGAIVRGGHTRHKAITGR
jgi:hypothetical protein